MNIDVGVRFGVSLDQGRRCYMEDTAACLTNAFSVKHGTRNPPEGPPEGKQPAHAAETQPPGGLSASPEVSTTAATMVTWDAFATAQTDASAASAAAAVPSGAAAYFGLFDGEDGRKILSFRNRHRNVWTQHSLQYLQKHNIEPGLFVGERGVTIHRCRRDFVGYWEKFKEIDLGRAEILFSPLFGPPRISRMIVFTKILS